MFPSINPVNYNAFNMELSTITRCSHGYFIYGLPEEDTRIEIEILRGGGTAFAGGTDIGQIKRPLESLAEYLFRDNEFPSGAYLMTGTGIVPPDAFTLDHGDEIRITIEPVGTLCNTVA